MPPVADLSLPVQRLLHGQASLDDVARALEDGADPNEWEAPGCPVRAAVQANNAPLLRLLVDKGADVNAKDSRGVGPLHMAVFQGLDDCAQLLLDAGADANILDRHGQTPLFFAPTPRLCELLVKNQADLNARNSKEQTALHLAAHAGLVDIVRWFLVHGALLLHQKDRKGKTPLMYASKSRTKSAVPVLETPPAPAIADALEPLPDNTPAETLADVGFLAAPDAVDVVTPDQQVSHDEMPLDITVVSAKGLRSTDWFQKSDPFCVCEVRGEAVFQTESVSNDSSPEWKHHVKIEKYRPADDLVFKVYDKDMFSSPELLGTATLTSRQFCPAGFEGTVPLEGGKGSEALLLLKIAPSALSSEAPVDAATEALPEEAEPEVAAQSVPRNEAEAERAAPQAAGGEAAPDAEPEANEPAAEEASQVEPAEESFARPAPPERNLEDELEAAEVAREVFPTLERPASAMRPATASSRGEVVQPELPLDIVVVGARDLKSADWFGKSDPFCSCEVSGRPVLRTETISNELNPSWNAAVRMPCYRVRDPLVFSVYDSDSLTEADLLGTATVESSLFYPAGFEGELPLQSEGKDTGAFLQLRLSPVLAPQAPRSVLEQVEVPEFGTPGSRGEEQASEAEAASRDEVVPLPHGVQKALEDARAEEAARLESERLEKERLEEEWRERSEQRRAAEAAEEERIARKTSEAHRLEAQVERLREEARLAEEAKQRAEEARERAEAQAAEAAKAAEAAEKERAARLAEMREEAEREEAARVQRAAEEEARLRLAAEEEAAAVARAAEAQERAVREDEPVEEVPLDITVESASGLRSTEWFGKSDPYCVCEAGGERLFETPTVSNDLNPSWNHSALVQRYRATDDLVFTVYDKDSMKDDLLGTAILEKERFLPEGFRGDLELSHEGKSAGRISVKIRPVLKEEPSNAKPEEEEVDLEATRGKARTALEEALKGDDEEFSEGEEAEPPPVSRSRSIVADEAVRKADDVALSEEAPQDEEVDFAATMEKARAAFEEALWDEEDDEKEEEEEEGQLDVVVVAAMGLRSADWFGKSDAYCVCELNGQPFLRTEVVQNSASPAWNARAHIERYKAGDKLVFRVLDSDAGSQDDELGTATLESGLFYPSGFEGNIPLEHGGKETGGFISLQISPVVERLLDPDGPSTTLPPDGPSTTFTDREPSLGWTDRDESSEADMNREKSLKQASLTLAEEEEEKSLKESEVEFAFAMDNAAAAEARGALAPESSEAAQEADETEEEEEGQQPELVRTITRKAAPVEMEREEAVETEEHAAMEAPAPQEELRQEEVEQNLQRPVDVPEKEEGEPEEDEPESEEGKVRRSIRGSLASAALDGSLAAALVRKEESQAAEAPKETAGKEGAEEQAPHDLDNEAAPAPAAFVQGGAASPAEGDHVDKETRLLRRRATEQLQEALRNGSLQAFVGSYVSAPEVDETGVEKAWGILDDFPFAGQEKELQKKRRELQASYDELLLNVTVVGISGLAPSLRSGTFCVCELEGEPALETDVVLNSPEPQWNHNSLINAYRPGEPLVFKVYNNNMVLGSARLQSKHFCPDGFEGEVPLQHDGESPAYLSLKIFPLPTSATNSAANRPSSAASAAPGSSARSKNWPPSETELLRPASARTAASSSRAGTSQSQRSRALHAEPCLNVSVLGARGLKGADCFGTSDPMCVCEINGEPRLTTQVIANSLNPVWNHSARIANYKPGDSLVFSVFDSDLGSRTDSLGLLTLESSCFYPSGFEGDVRLENAGSGVEAYLSIKIEPIPVAARTDSKSSKGSKASRSEHQSLVGIAPPQASLEDTESKVRATLEAALPPEERQPAVSSVATDRDLAFGFEKAQQLEEIGLDDEKDSTLAGSDLAAAAVVSDAAAGAVFSSEEPKARPQNLVVEPEQAIMRCRIRDLQAPADRDSRRLPSYEAAVASPETSSRDEAPASIQRGSAVTSGISPSGSGFTSESDLSHSEQVRREEKDGCLFWDVVLKKDSVGDKFGFAQVNGRAEFEVRMPALTPSSSNPETDSSCCGPEVLIVRRIHEGGLLHRWCTRHAEAEVLPQDRVCAVNGETTVEGMLREIRNRRISLRFMRYPEHFVVHLRKNGHKLGFRIQPSSPQELRVTEVLGVGALQAYNREQIAAGRWHYVLLSDMCIESTNNIAGDATAMAEELKTCEAVSMRVRRNEHVLFSPQQVRQRLKILNSLGGAFNPGATSPTGNAAGSSASQQDPHAEPSSP